ncbi:16428_t:CDS:2, partial [Dentiscutata heterogama]
EVVSELLGKDKRRTIFILELFGEGSGNEVSGKKFFWNWAID